MYNTKDLKFSVILLTLGHKLVSSYKQGREVWFEFDIDEDQVNQIMVNYINEDLEVNVKKLFKNLDILKSMTFNY